MIIFWGFGEKFTGTLYSRLKGSNRPHCTGQMLHEQERLTAQKRKKLYNSTPSKINKQI